MLDINYIRENRGKVEAAVINKGCDVSVAELLELDERRKSLGQKVDSFRQERNEIAGKMKNGKPEKELVERGRGVKAELVKLEGELAEIEGRYITLLKLVPNVPCDDVPVGLSEDENVVAEVVGEPTKFDFVPKNHYEIGMSRGWIDKERAAKVVGSRFAYIMGDMVKLQMAIVNFVIASLTDERVMREIVEKNGLDVSVKPFVPVLPPLMIRTDMYDAMDRLEPRDDRYKIEGEDLWLQGSAEHVLGSMHAGEIFEKDELPLRYLGYATSFRQEAGTYGKDMEGIIRMHQFDKLEMESFSTAETSRSEHELFVAIQRWLLEKLALPYQVIEKCTFDIGKPDARAIDMEVWLPGQDKYRETHTADYMTDYQSRRLNIRVKTKGGLELVHTNDATAFALGRIMIAIIENYQNEDMTVRVPEVLKPFINGKEKI
ncbi:MAG: serine--tRNA ligase [Candidatus Nomurabacteria bacterium]|jgi:seryl-tRNA synthetase|nr:serine--tRNA ligase [Candidatus Nomurabacteria bacterium]